MGNSARSALAGQGAAAEAAARFALPALPVLPARINCHHAPALWSHACRLSTDLHSFRFAFACPRIPRPHSDIVPQVVRHRPRAQPPGSAPYQGVHGRLLVALRCRLSVRSVAGAILPRVGCVSCNFWTDGWRDREHDRRSAEAEAFAPSRPPLQPPSTPPPRFLLTGSRRCLRNLPLLSSPAQRRELHRRCQR
jgi:hypothetical protein